MRTFCICSTGWCDTPEHEIYSRDGRRIRPNRDNFASSHERNWSDGCRSKRGLVDDHDSDEPWSAMRPVGVFAAGVESQQQSQVGEHAIGRMLLLPPPYSWEYASHPQQVQTLLLQCVCGDLGDRQRPYGDFIVVFGVSVSEYILFFCIVSSFSVHSRSISILFLFFLSHLITCILFLLFFFILRVGVLHGANTRL